MYIYIYTHIDMYIYIYSNLGETTHHFLSAEVIKTLTSTKYISTKSPYRPSVPLLSWFPRRDLPRTIWCEQGERAGS